MLGRTPYGRFSSNQGLVASVASYGSLSPLQQWRQQFFGTTDGTGTRANLADFDLDGRTNLEEFGLGLDPTSGTLGALVVNGSTLTRRGLPQAICDPGTGASKVLFTRRLDAATAGLNYTVQFSANLVDWFDSTDTPLVIANDLEIEAVTVAFPAVVGGQPARFVRIVIELP